MAKNSDHSESPRRSKREQPQSPRRSKRAPEDAEHRRSRRRAAMREVASSPASSLIIICAALMAVYFTFPDMRTPAASAPPTVGSEGGKSVAESSAAATWKDREKMTPNYDAPPPRLSSAAANTAAPAHSAALDSAAEPLHDSEDGTASEGRGGPGSAKVPQAIPNGEVVLRIDVISGGVIPSGLAVCRVWNTVVVVAVPNLHGAILLPDELKTLPDLEHVLRSCGIDKLEFFSAVRTKLNLPASASELPLMPLDVIQPLPVPRYHMPHFVDDVMDHLATFGAALATGTGVSYETRSHCYQSGTWGACAAADPVAPAVILEPKTRSGKGAWARALLQSLTSDGHSMVFLYHDQDDALPNGVLRPRSSFLGPALAPRSLDSAAFASHPLFGREALLGTPLTSSDPVCKGGELRVLIVDRLPQRIATVPHAGGRDILKRDELVEALSTSLGAYCASGPSCRVKIDINTFDNISFAKQAELFNSADIVLGSHGAAFANVLYMRRGALLHELIPFGYVAPLFGELATAFGVKWSLTMAQPMLSHVLVCAKHTNRKNLHTDTQQQLTSWTALFTQAASNFTQAGVGVGLESWRNYNLKHAARSTNLKFIYACLRSQSLVADIEHVVGSLKSWLDTRCARPVS